jgi:hypothetical protein
MLRGLLPLLISTCLGSVTDCSKGSSLFTLTSMSFSPDPAVPGENSTLLLSMTVPQEIKGGTVRYSTTYNFIPFSPTVEPLCLNIECPILVGDLHTYSSFPIDPSLSGTLQLRIEWKDLSEVQLLCVEIKTKI